MDHNERGTNTNYDDTVANEFSRTVEVKEYEMMHTAKQMKIYQMNFGVKIFF
jgi:hypothetical protein